MLRIADKESYNTVITSAEVALGNNLFQLNPNFDYVIHIKGDLGGATETYLYGANEVGGDDLQYEESDGTIPQMFNFTPPPSGVVFLSCPGVDGFTAIGVHLQRRRR